MARPVLTFWEKKSRAAYVKLVRGRLQRTVIELEGYISQHDAGVRPRAKRIVDATCERKAIEQAYSSRWQGRQVNPRNLGTLRVPDDLIDKLRHGRMPWTDSGKQEKRKRETDWSSHRLFKLDQAIAKELQGLCSDWHKAFPAAIECPTGKLPLLPPGIRDDPGGLSTVVPGAGPLVVQVGWLAWAPWVGVPTIGGYGISSMTSTELQGVHSVRPFPFLVDFAVDGGFATNHRDTVESAVSRLLALIPAGQLKVHLFDPVKVGASLRFLSELGDATRAAVADIRVVNADLEPLLDDLTRHIARVAQQCLGSRHRTLTDYNRAAGEVVEAYHLLVIMDYPSGRVDDEVVRKMGTVINAGAACGVYTVVLSNDPAQHPFGLPVLRDGHWEDASAISSGVQGVSPATSGASRWPSLDDVVSPDWKRSISISAKAMWSGSRWTPSTSVEVRTLGKRLDRDIAGAKPRSITPAEIARRLRQLPGYEQRADPNNTATWWRESAVDGVEAVIGASGDRGVASVEFRSANGQPFALLVGGQPGTGKSVFLHAMICDLARNYSPSELQLYLLDPKQGVEFSVYAGETLPHAKLITLAASAESTTLVLEDLVGQIERRGKIMRTARTSNGAPPDKLDDYLKIPGVPKLPRIVAVIDEFQAILNTGDDQESMNASSLLDRVIREGRAFGIHVVLASQSLQGIRHLPPSVTGMIDTKLVFLVSEDDSRLFLGPQDLEASRLSKAGGKAVLKRAGIGSKQVQITHEAKGSAQATTTLLATRFGKVAKPLVLDFSKMRPITVIPRAIDSRGQLALPVARGLGAAPSVAARFPRNDDGHLLLVAGGGDQGSPGPALGSISTMLAVCVHAGIPFDVIDFGDLQTPFDLYLGNVNRAISDKRYRIARGRLFVGCVEQALAAARGSRSGTITHRLIFLVNAHRSRDLLNGSGAGDKLRELLEIGGAHRVHVILHCDTGNSAARIMSQGGMLEFFGSKLVTRLDSDSSYQLLGSNEAERLGIDQLLLLEASGQRTKGAPFSPAPGLLWKRITK